MTRQTKLLLDGLAYVESPRWHDDRLWFSHWGTEEIVAVGPRREVGGRRPWAGGDGLGDRVAARRPHAADRSRAAAPGAGRERWCATPTSARSRVVAGPRSS